MTNYHRGDGRSGYLECHSLRSQGEQLQQPLNPPNPDRHTALPMTTWVSAVNHTPRHHLPITPDSPGYEV